MRVPRRVDVIDAIRQHAEGLRAAELGLTQRVAAAIARANSRAATLEKTDVFTANPVAPDIVAPTGLGDMPDMNVTLDPEGFPVVAFFSCQVVSLHISAGFKQVSWQLLAGAIVVPQAQREVNLIQNADIASVSFVVPIIGLTSSHTFKVRWGVISQQPGLESETNPRSSGIKRSFAVLRLGTP